jgi:hypothetical protein
MWAMVSEAIMVERKGGAAPRARGKTGRQPSRMPSARRFFRSQYHAIQMQIS